MVSLNLTKVCEIGCKIAVWTVRMTQNRGHTQRMKGLFNSLV